VNWQINADNRGNDWYYESVPGSSRTPGEMGDTFIANRARAGAQAMITIPTIDWVAKLGPNRSKLASFSIAKYGAQTGNDWQVVRRRRQRHPYQRPVRHRQRSERRQRAVVGGLPAGLGAAPGRPLGHERRRRPALLRARQRAEHLARHTPRRPSDRRDHDEVLTKSVDFATAIKTVDASALVVGPEEWGWSGYFYSGYDQQYGGQHGWGTLPDRINHGGADYLPWFLDTMRQRSTAAGRRLLDVFTVHYYPQGGEFSDDVSTRCSSGATDRRARCGIRTTSTRRGSTTACG
jgi:hypothetical protein